MIRITLIAVATIATIATISPAAAQAGAPVRTLGPSDLGPSDTVTIAERKAVPCADKSCTNKPPKRYVAAPPFGW
jgi:hypothetical protein